MGFSLLRLYVGEEGRSAAYKRRDREWRGGGTQCVHGRSRMAIDPGIRTMPEWSTCTNQADIACTKREEKSAKRREVFGESDEG